MVLRRQFFNLRNALNDRSAEHDVVGITRQGYVPHKKTLKTYQTDYSRALSPVFLKRLGSLISAHDENSPTFSARLPETRRRFCKIWRRRRSFLYQVFHCDSRIFPKAQSISWS